MIQSVNRSLLRRRENIISSLQPGVDGLALICVTWALIKNQIGILTTDYALMMLLLLGILAVVFDHYGVYRRHASFTQKVVTLIKAWTLSFCILTFIGFASKQGENFSRLLIGQLFVAGLSCHIIFHLGTHFLQKTWLRHNSRHDHALILGEGDVASYLAMKVKDNPWLGQELVGRLSMDEPGQHGEGGKESGFDESLPYLGGIENLREIIDRYHVSTVYIVTPLQKSKVLEDIYFTLLDKQIAVHWIPDIFSLRLVNHSVSEIAGIPVLTLSETPLTGMRLLAKLIEDKILSALLILVFSPLLLLIALLIKLDSKGPVFFRQNRAGWSGKQFRIWKFRSMYVHQPENGEVRQATRDDPRVTRIGRFLRKTSLDELPQLFNVITGDMSLVGPRPHAIQHDEEYSQRISDYFARHHIKPGITGLAQVRGFRGETKEISEMAQRVQADIEYINNWSIWLDLTILLRSVKAFSGSKAY